MRWKGYDYARSADYFVTVVCHDRRNFLGRIEDDQVVLSPAGEMVDKAIDAMIDRYDDSELLGKVVMPNHIHLVIGKYEEHVPLSEMMAWLKGVSTHYYNIGVRQEGWVPYRDTLWQRGYYDHVVRNERALEYILRYIMENPARWSAEHLNPDCKHPDEIMKTIRGIELGTPPPVKP